MVFGREYGLVFTLVSTGMIGATLYGFYQFKGIEKWSINVTENEVLSEFLKELK